MLSYSTEARRCFDPVAAKHGLSCASADESEVLYEDAHAFLSVSFDNGGSYELRVRCGLRASPIESPSLSEIMTLENSPDAFQIDGMMSSTAPALATCLRRLGDLAMRYAPIAFGASDAWFQQLAELRRKENWNYAVNSDLIVAKKKAGAAWERKDFAGVVAAFGPVRFYLSLSERKKLEYAIRKCTTSNGLQT